MMRAGPPVPVAALLSGVLTAAAAAQGAAPDSVFPSAEPSLSSAIAENTFGREQARPPRSSVAAPQGEPLAGNPLWAIPISELPQTRARPLFSASRRPPAPPVAAALLPPAKPNPPPKPEPDHPLLTLLGTIVSQSVEIGVFVDEASHDVIRLKTGAVHDGWTLSSVVGRTAIFQKDGHHAATLVLPVPGAEAAAANGGATNAVTQPVAVPSNSQITGVPPANTVEPHLIPETTKGGWKREPREG
jgi:general secretion pathway protein N